MTSLDRSDDSDLLVALAHPLRRDILREMIGEEAISPREIAGILDRSLSTVAYHVRVLADHAVITLVDTKQVRGSLQHFYRSALEAPWAQQILELGEREAGSTGESSADPAP